MLSQKYIKTALIRIFFCATLSGASWETLLNVDPWLTDNFYEENNLCNVVLTILEDHCIGLLSSQCCLDTSKTTLNRKIKCAMLVKGAQTCFRRKISYTMLS